ncbi:MAG: transglutaminase domain-containing protein [Betaproteobacteria bacterium]|nr:transglutaminase domain-containing protein [Betaproteobacteria bacterium]
MKTLPALLAAACALWGAQTGYWIVAAAAAVALEAPRFVTLRWNVEQAHFNRLSDFCSALIVAAGVYLYFTYGNPRALMLLFQWMPVLLLPLALAQAWGNLREVDIAAFVWTLRKSPAAERFALNLGYPYLAAWIVAAAAANVRGPGFFIGLIALVAWALWAARPRRYPLVLWVALLAATAGAGYGTQLGLHRVQAWMEEVIPEWISASGSRTDPYRSRTDLGAIGELKQDDAIVLRLRADEGVKTPLLLHRASYNSYFGRTWSARNAPLVARPPETGTRWALRRDAAPGARVTVFDYSPRGNPVLALPRGTVELRGLEALSLLRNGLGTVQAELPPGYFTYVAVVNPGAGIDDSPNQEDLRIPLGEQSLFGGIVERLGLSGLPPGEAAAAVKRYFADGFGYSLYQEKSFGSRSALADFLLRTRAGHCEYFATATVLLLRAAGVPARYATGFSAQEYSRLENAWIVRVRHAHAWAKAWVDGRWVDVDTTPSTWARIEGQQASAWWSAIADLWSWLRFRLSQLGAGGREEERTAAIAAGIALLVGLWFGWRLYRQRRLMVFGKRGEARQESRAQGADSELYLIERELAKAGLGRLTSETIMTWVARVKDRLPRGMDANALARVVRLHYRLRFDPAGLPAPERDELRSGARACLAQMRDS